MQLCRAGTAVLGIMLPYPYDNCHAAPAACFLFRLCHVHVHCTLASLRVLCVVQGISKNLVEKAFPVAERPDYLTGPDFYKFTPAEEFMSLPGDIARTEFRLVITHDGWEYCILERDLGAHLDSHRNMLVTVRGTIQPVLGPCQSLWTAMLICLEGVGKGREVDRRQGWGSGDPQGDGPLLIPQGVTSCK